MRKFLNLTEPQTYKIISLILKKKKFTQKDIITAAKVSKSWVSKVIKRLESKSFIKKINSNYVLQQPAGLMGLFNLVRSMEDNKIASLSIEAGRKTVMKELIKRKVIFCLSTALQEYSEYYQDPSINFYTDDEELIKGLKEERKGMTQINIFRPDLCLETEIEKKGKMLLTGKIRTIIDLICNEQAYATKALIETEFGERIG